MDEEAAKEAAKAVQEVAKTTGKVIDAATRVGGFLSKVVGNAAVEVGATIQDWAIFQRYKNLLRLQDKVEAIHASRKLEGKSIPVPPRFAIPLLQAASQEDDDSIQDLWAGLIANATDPQRHLDLKRVFIDILNSLEPLDTRLLQYLAGLGWMMYQNAGGGANTTKLATELKVTKKDVQFSLLNLHRLECIIDEYQITYDEAGTHTSALRVTNDKTTFRLSPLGFALLTACESTGPISESHGTG
jgi:abortive infection alpha-like protein